MIGENLYAPIKAQLEKLGDALDRYGVEPLHLTLTGLLFNMLACLVFAYGHLAVGSLIVIFAALFDILDGSLARSTGKTSLLGAFLDSVIDRYSDTFILGGLLIFYAGEGKIGMVILVLAAIAGAFLTSYAKARGENFIKNCSVGWVGRPERLFIICVGGLFNLMGPAMFLLTVISHITVLQRIFFVRKNIEEKPAKPNPPPKDSPKEKILPSSGKPNKIKTP